MQQRLASIGLIILGALVAALALWGLVNEVGGKWVTFLWALLGAAGSALAVSGKMALEAMPVYSGEFQHYAAEDRSLDGQPYQVTFTPRKIGKRGHPSSLVLTAPLALPTHLQFNAKTSFDSVATSLGVTRELQTADEVFDEQIYVRASLETYALRYLSDPERRQAILALKDLGFEEIRLTPAEAQACWTGFDPERDDRVGLVEDAARSLLTLTRQPPELDHRVDEAKSAMFWPVTLWTLLILYACLFVCAFQYQPVRNAGLIVVSLVAYGLSLPVFALIAGVLVRGRSNSHDQWLAVTIGAVFLLFPGSLGTVSAVNALADGSPPAEHRVLVIGLRTRPNQSWLQVQGWNGGPPVEFSALNDEYLRAVPGRSEMHLVVGRGALGIEWLHSKQIRF